MPSRTFGIFLEDFAQEQYLKCLAEKVLLQREIDCTFQPYVSAGGRPAVVGQLRSFFKLSEMAVVQPDYIIIGNDGNCQGFNGRRNEVLNHVPDNWRHRVILAIPDPHIEAWFFRDLPAFHRAVGPCNAPPVRKCNKGFYKGFLKNATRGAIGIAPLNGIENARAIVLEQSIGVLRNSGNDMTSFIEGLDAVV
jgi:hypothetical protein